MLRKRGMPLGYVLKISLVQKPFLVVFILCYNTVTLKFMKAVSAFRCPVPSYKCRNKDKRDNTFVSENINVM